MTAKINNFLRKVFILIVFLSMVPAAAQQVIKGTVFNLNNEPLEEVEIRIKGAKIMKTRTDANGEFSLNDLPKGRYELEGEKQGAFITDEFEIDQLDYVKTYYMPLHAQTEALDQVVLNGAKSVKSELEKSGFAVNIIEMDKISYQNVSTNELLNQSVGVHLRSDGGHGSSVRYALNGMSGNSVRVFINGIPLSSYGSSFNLSSIPPTIIDRIEVYKGVVPAELASDALGGAINIVLKKGVNNNLGASVSYGSFNTFQTHLNGRYRDENSGFTTELSAFQNYSDNDYKVWGRFAFDFTPEGTKKYVKARRFNDRYRAFGLRAGAGFTDVGWADRFMIGYNGSKTYKEIQHGATMVTPYKDRYMEPRANVLTFDYAKSDILTKGLDFKTNYIFSKRKQFVSDLNEYRYHWNGEIAKGMRGEALRTTGGAQQGEKTLYHADREISALRSGLSYEFLPDNRLSVNHLFHNTDRKERDELKTSDQQAYVGTRELQQHIVSGGYEGHFLNQTLKTNLFVKSYHQNLEKMEPRAEIIDGTSTRVEEKAKADVSKTGYGFAVSYSFWEAFMLTGSAEKAVRMPVENEVFGSIGENIVENFDLRPEQSDNINIGIKIGPYEVQGKHRLSIYTSGFYRDTKDKIMRKAEDQFVESIQTAPFVNLGKTFTYGFETELNYQYNRNLNLLVNMTHFKSLYNVRFDEQGNTLYRYRQQLPNEPTFNLNAGLNYRFSDILQKHAVLQLHYDFGWVKNFYTIWKPGRNITNRKSILRQMEVPEQKTHDIGLSYLFPKRDFTLSIDAKNIFNAQVYDNFAVQKPGRAFYVKINYRIHQF